MQQPIPVHQQGERNLTMEPVTWDIANHVEHLLGRFHGPLSFRIIIQPLVAIVLAIRAGLKDARAGRPAFGWALVTDSAHRSQLLRESWNDVAMVFIAAVIIDLIYEIIVLRRIYLGQSLIVATTLALVPYMVIRGPVNRIARLWRRRRPG
ncbi:MAG: hypothetical protein JWR69_2845 [Pedosphaera sp.]|nr:hypothetical protein [Pedosphaera sp.]